MIDYLPKAFLDRMRAELGPEYAAFLASYNEPPTRGLRVNTLKAAHEELAIALAKALAEAMGISLTPSGTVTDSFVITGGAEGLGKHPYHLAGLFYMQEPSASLPMALADIAPGMRVLDMCAAPGGKSGAAAARLSGRGFLLSNEIVPARARVLASTLERLGVANSAVTSARPDAVAQAFPGYFDVVLVDAPCSGEGMFRKDREAAAEWSLEHVRACAERQGMILESAKECVAAGGALVYSTCTFSHEENEGAVERFLAANPDFSLGDMRRLYPHTSVGEGHFAARLVRASAPASAKPNAASLPLKRHASAEYERFMKDTFIKAPEGEAYTLPDGRVTLLREPLPAGLAKLRALTSGVVAGEVAKGRFEPAHSLFLAAHGGEYARSVSLDADDPLLMRYLSGEAMPLDEDMRGFAPVCVKMQGESYPLGFGKAADGMLKNRLPKGLRL